MENKGDTRFVVIRAYPIFNRATKFLGIITKYCRSNPYRLVRVFLSRIRYSLPSSRNVNAVEEKTRVPLNVPLRVFFIRVKIVPSCPGNDRYCFSEW